MKFALSHKLVQTIVFASFILASNAQKLTAQYSTVPLDHQVYPFLQKAEAQQLVQGFALRVLPLSRDLVREQLQFMNAKRDKLSKADRALLAQMLAEFTDPEIGQKAPDGSEIHLLRYEEGRSQIFVDARMVQNFRFRQNRLGVEDENISETIGLGAIRGRLGKRVHFGLTARNTMTLGENETSENFDPTSGEIVSRTGAAGFRDQATGYVAAKFGHFGVLIGRNDVSWGSGNFEQLAVSSQNEPLDLIQFSFEFEKFRLTSFHGNLLGNETQRYLAGHRLDFAFWKKFQFGVYETLTYGGRDVELGYVNPFLLFHIMEHQYGDRDNNVLGFDFSWLPGAGVRIYGELFVDDFSFNKSPFTYWGNKLAYLIGGHWAQPLGLRTVELFGSYTRVDPWVYTHHLDHNIYYHYSASIGSKLGPNADRFKAGLAIQPLRDTRFEFFFRSIRKGKGDVFTAHTFEDGVEKNFLEGTLEKRREFDLRLRHQIRQDVFAGLGYLSRSRENVDLIEGQETTERYARFFLDVNY